MSRAYPDELAPKIGAEPAFVLHWLIMRLARGCAEAPPSVPEGTRWLDTSIDPPVVRCFERGVWRCD